MKLADVFSKIADGGKGTLEARLNMVKDTKDQNVLAEIAKTYRIDADVTINDAANDKDWEVCKAAVDGITDQGLLAKVAINHGHIIACEAALEKITDQGLLWKVAISDGRDCICEAAVEKI
ncbi:MAG: hypothetical protein KAI76_00895, partial [Alphaproteobacteria bacterium]|nr:hypothetical protein [Alphaproteobacteria bacterium]